MCRNSSNLLFCILYSLFRHFSYSVEALRSILTGLYLQLLLHHGHRRRLFVLKVNFSEKHLYSHFSKIIFIVLFLPFCFCFVYFTSISPSLILYVTYTLPHLYCTSFILYLTYTLPHLHCTSLILYLIYTLPHLCFTSFILYLTFFFTPHLFLNNLFYKGGDDMGI